MMAGTSTLLRGDPSYASLAIEVSGGNPIVQADVEQLRTVFLNLLLNAAQPSGGTVVTVTLPMQ
jgi:signal transduction histidine kinase